MSKNDTAEKAPLPREKKNVSAATRAKLSARMKAIWAEKRAKGEAIAPDLNLVKYVADDDVTRAVEVLRKLMPHDLLAGLLKQTAYRHLDDEFRPNETAH